MREILFRGKRVNDGDWVVGALVDYYPDLAYIKAPVKTEFGTTFLEYFEVYPLTVGQYTGLNDKNGKRIFEGDIVQGYNFWRKNLTKYQIEFSEGCFFLVDKNGSFWHKDHNENIEVIGNVHDNPELIAEVSE